MAELQATLEFQVELSKFYNVDLFQRGYYQLRTALKTAPKAPVKVELSLPRNNECPLVFPASVINGVAVSKTFQILYRNEDVSVDDVILFKVQMLVDSQRVEESIEQAEFSLVMELWFTEEEVGPEYQDKLQCISQRTLQLNLNPNQGLHHHVPVLFDYFHLCVMCVTVHATLISLHQPYISIPGRVPKAAWSKEQSPLEGIYFIASSRPSTPGFNNLDIRLREACVVHKLICQLLLSAYESLQTSFHTLVARLPPYCKKIRIEQKDCHKELDNIMETMQKMQDEEDFLSQAQTDVANLCAENVIMWSQYLELVTLHEKVTHILAKEHHIQRVKRFSEFFFSKEQPKLNAIACYDNTTHSHVDLNNLVRSSRYFSTLPGLEVQCVDLDGDQLSLPVVFEDIFCDLPPAKQFRSSPEEASLLRHRDSRSDSSAEYSSDSSPKFKRGSKLNFIKNIKPESVVRPSVTGGGQSRLVANNVAGLSRPNATLVGYKKMNTDQDNAPIVELGTLSPAPNLTSGRFTQIAASMPSLLGQSHAHLVHTGSMPDLNRSLSLKDSLLKKSAQKADSIGESDLESVRRRLTLPSETMSPLSKNEEDIKVDSASLSDSSTGDVQNGFMPSDTDSQANTETSSQVNASSGSQTDSQPPKTAEQCEANAKSLEVKDNSGTLSVSDTLGQNVNSGDDSVTGLAEALTQALGDEDSGRPGSSVAPSNAPSDSGVASLQDVSLSNSQLSSLSHSESNKSTQDTNSNTSSSTLKKSSSSASTTSNTVALSNRSADNSDYMSSECTIMELLREEYNAAQKNSSPAGSAPGTPSFGHRALGMRAGLGRPPGRAVAVTRPSTSGGGGAVGNGVVSKPRQSLVSPVADKTINFIAAKENLRKNIFYTGSIYSDFPTQCSSIPYFWPPEIHHHHDNESESSRETEDTGIHLVVCVHGLDGNSADLRLVRTYLEMSLPGARIDFLMSERNQPDTFADFEVMTDKLVEEILYHIEVYGMQPKRISFVGHSLGNLIIRSALSRPRMEPLLDKMYTFLSLSGPHLGTLYNSSGLVNMGMWFMQKWKKSGSLLQLSLKDHSDPRQTFLYKLSKKPGLEHFKHILLVSSTQDRYVPYHSSRIELCKSAVKDTSGIGGVYAEMVHNLLQPLIDNPSLMLVRYDVFHALQNTANSIIGRAAHIAVLDSELFIEKFITVAGLKYFK